MENAPNEGSSVEVSTRSIDDEKALSLFPLTARYEESWMHAGEVTLVSCSGRGNATSVVTADNKGFIKLWRSSAVSLAGTSGMGRKDGALIMETERQGTCLEFIKGFYLFNSGVAALSTDPSGVFCAISGHSESVVKVANCRTFDVCVIVDVGFAPSSIALVRHPADATRLLLLAANPESFKVSAFSLYAESHADSSEEWAETEDLGDVTAQPKRRAVDAKPAEVEVFESGAMWSFERHRYRVHRLVVDEDGTGIVSLDLGGGIEFWDTSFITGESILTGVTWSKKVKTDLFTLQKHKTYARSGFLRRSKGLLLLTCGDDIARLFNLTSGKLIRTVALDLKSATKVQVDEATPIWRRVDNFEFGRRVGVEKYVAIESRLDEQESCFIDESGTVFIVPSIEGLVVYRVDDGQAVASIGKSEQLRFIGFSVLVTDYTAPKAPLESKHGGDTTESNIQLGLRLRKNLILATAFNEDRVFVFSKVEPLQSSIDGTELSRDRFNEMLQGGKGGLGDVLPKQYLTSGGPIPGRIVTTKGDIGVELFDNFAPRTVENFRRHANDGYFDNVLFHRVICKFMIQTGDPSGDGTGGESIWGGKFDDELSQLRHDGPYYLSMANAGPNTNGSQFFITTVACPHLDGKHTIFGKVTEGFDVVHAIECSPVTKLDRPREDIRVISVQVGNKTVNV